MPIGARCPDAARCRRCPTAGRRNLSASVCPGDTCQVGGGRICADNVLTLVTYTTPAACDTCCSIHSEHKLQSRSFGHLHLLRIG